MDPALGVSKNTCSRISPYIERSKKSFLYAILWGRVIQWDTLIHNFRRNPQKECQTWEHVKWTVTDKKCENRRMVMEIRLRSNPFIYIFFFSNETFTSIVSRIEEDIIPNVPEASRSCVPCIDSGSIVSNATTDSVSVF